MTDVEKAEVLKQLSKPLIEFLATNYNHYCSIAIDNDGAKVIQTIVFSPKDKSV
ncbi:MAG: hypothetical protein FWE05_13675 [Defluviitaleaceae bacterium]|nr:hypothetical protein [Defluviitaleaceae bacterium]